MAMLLAMGLSACGGSGNSGSSQTASGTGSVSASASNGSFSVAASVQSANADYVSDALVCIDSNDNGVCDADDVGGVYTDNKTLQKTILPQNTILLPCSEMALFTNQELIPPAWTLIPRAASLVR